MADTPSPRPSLLADMPGAIPALIADEFAYPTSEVAAQPEEIRAAAMARAYGQAHDAPFIYGFRWIIRERCFRRP